MWDHDNLDEVHMNLLSQNIIELGGEINSDMAHYVREAILRLTGRGSPAIKVLITSNGGNVNVGLDIYDLLRLYPGEKTGFVQGFARSMAVIVLQSCGKRVAARHSRLQIHYISMHEMSLAELRDKKKTDEIRDDMESSQKMIRRILSERSGRSEKEIEAEFSKDHEMDAEEARKFGLIDELI